MEISAQSIQTVGGQSGPISTIVAGLKPGDSLSAQVLARSPNGQAIVALAGKQVQLPLPPTLPPGTLLKLTVQQGSNGLQFLVEAQGGAVQAANAARPALPNVPTGQPATTGGAPTPTPAGTASPAAPAAAQISTAAPAQTSAVLAPSAPTVSSGTTPLPPLVNTRTGLPVPAPQGATIGQTLTAQVLTAPTGSTAIIALGGQELPVSLPTPAAPGTALTFVVQKGPDGLQLAHAPRGNASAPTQTATATPGQAGTAGGTSAQPAAASALMATAVPVPTPSAVLAQANFASLGNQNSVSVLLASVLRLGDRARELPDGVQRAVERFSNSVMRLEARAPNAQTLKNAVARSGAFLESQLAAGAGKAAVEGDLKAVLMGLRRSLTDWLGSQAKPAALGGKPPPLPQQGTAPRAPAPPPPSQGGDERPLTDIGKSLLSQTDAALSRIRLGQIASMPDLRPDAPPAAHKEVHVELPVTIGQQPGVLSLVITRDDDDGNDPDQRQPTWRVQFAINASVIGEVGAEVGLLAGKTNVVLSAAEPDTVSILNDTIGELSQSLEAVGLVPGNLRVRRMGAPPPSVFPSAPKPSGHYLDRDT